MELRYHKKFEKRYKKLSGPVKGRVDDAIQRFVANSHDSLLRNHALQGKLQGKRAFSVGGEIRIVFEEFDDYVIVLFLDVGTHNQVYND